MNSSTSHLRPDGSTFPPVTPDPPLPPGYVAPIELELVLEAEADNADQSADQDPKGDRR